MSRTDPTWITGVGAATSLGNSYAEIARRLLAGESGVRTIDHFDTSEHECRIAAFIHTLPCPDVFDQARFDAHSRLDQLGIWCCSAALADAGLWDQRKELRIGVVLGVGAEAAHHWEKQAAENGGEINDPARDAEPLINVVGRELALRGPAMTISTACASANHALGLARRWLRMGWADVCLAGGCDMGVTPMGMATFSNLRALSQRNDDPAGASRPFDRSRDGFVLAEGGAVFVLESAARARRRSARAYAELAGCGYSSDAHHIIIPRPDSGPVEKAIRAALADAGVMPTDIDYINAHATATPVGDVAESLAIQRVLGNAADRIPVSSTKSMTGHLLTGASAIEAIACMAALENQAVPPTINLDDVDPACALCHVPHVAQERQVKIAVSNAFGFGGSNSCVVFRAA